MHNDCDGEHILLLLCRQCHCKFYWGTVYHGISELTKCPNVVCKASGSKPFIIQQRIHNGTLVK
ncbi:hypothetical protein FBPa8_0024 [Pseudomonas phage vB_PaeP_FBPa8]|nr:hypothetical protein FBPa8_0024 [Pseudomonas phage vB_PaeP_FBPa8]